MNSLDEILELLLDEEWHRVRDLCLKLEYPETKLREILRFLSEHGFVHYRESDNSVRIQPQLKTLMEN